MRVFLTNLKKIDSISSKPEVQVIPNPRLIELGVGGFTIAGESFMPDSPLPKTERTYENKLHEDQGYFLEISDGKVEIEAKTETGLFYGVQTLIQLFAQREDSTVYLPSISIIDYPDMEIRGISDDNGRGQTPTLENMIKHIRILTKYKMNAIFSFSLFRLGQEEDVKQQIRNYSYDIEIKVA